jgi:hypothetical protein
MARPSRNTSRDEIQNGSRTFFVTSRTISGRSLLQTERMANLFIDVPAASRARRSRSILKLLQRNFITFSPDVIALRMPSMVYSLLLWFAVDVSRHFE